mmetsp:Transcript_2413/g.7362  ORF Transcript_2413/g.7362 Transcript_2413/m.7362 type:complete len:260 (-) Transcript_2413:27-806(-)
MASGVEARRPRCQGRRQGQGDAARALLPGCDPRRGERHRVRNSVRVLDLQRPRRALVQRPDHRHRPRLALVRRPLSQGEGPRGDGGRPRAAPLVRRRHQTRRPPGGRHMQLRQQPVQGRVRPAGPSRHGVQRLRGGESQPVLRRVALGRARGAAGRPRRQGAGVREEVVRLGRLRHEPALHVHRRLGAGLQSPSDARAARRREPLLRQRGTRAGRGQGQESDAVALNASAAALLSLSISPAHLRRGPNAYPAAAHPPKN